MAVTRITKLKGFDNVLAGRDLANIFKEGHVYAVNEIAGVIMINDLGEHAILRIGKHEGFSIQQIMLDGSYCLTKEEKQIQDKLNEIDNY